MGKHAIDLGIVWCAVNVSAQVPTVFLEFRGGDLGACKANAATAEVLSKEVRVMKPAYVDDIHFKIICTFDPDPLINSQWTYRKYRCCHLKGLIGDIPLGFFE